MKKITIAGAGVAMIGVGVLPFAGVFAATTQTDTVSVSVAPSCSIVVTAGNGADSVDTSGTTTTYTVGIANGHIRSDLGGTQMSITCNSPSGWHLTAVGNGGTTLTTTGGGTAIATGTNTSGTSSWAFKVSGTGASSSYTGFSAVPASAKTVASGSGVVNGNVITANYQVYIGATQGAGTYTGGVVYTVASGQN